MRGKGTGKQFSGEGGDEPLCYLKLGCRARPEKKAIGGRKERRNMDIITS